MELLIATAALALGVFAVVGAFRQGAAAQRRAFRRVVLLSAASSVIEEMCAREELEEGCRSGTLGSRPRIEWEARFERIRTTLGEMEFEVGRLQVEVRVPQWRESLEVSTCVR